MKIWSVFTDDLEHCYLTGTPYCHIHHIFPGARRKRSEKRGFVITAVFDVNPRLIGMSIRGVEIYDVDTMEEYVRNNKVDVAILTLPRSQAAKAATDLASWGVKGIWNFSHVDLALPKDVMVENVHLTDSIMTLLYKINEVNNELESN